MPTKPSYEDLEKRIAGLERANRILEKAIDGLPQPVVVADAEDQIVYLNSSAKRRCQLTAKDAIGRFFFPKGLEQVQLKSQLLSVMELARIGYWEYDVQADQFTFNDQFYKLFRTTAELAGGYVLSSSQYAEQFVHPEDRDIVGNAIRKDIETADPSFSQQLEHRILYADGSIGHIAVRYFIAKDGEGKTVKTYGLNQDITDRKQMEQARLVDLKFFENMDRISRAIQRNNDIEQMMRDVLDVVLAIFKCHRAWLGYPCDPYAATWHTPMERTTPDYPGAFVLGLEVPMDADVASLYGVVLTSNDPVGFGPGNEHPLPEDVAGRFSIRSQLSMAIYPKTDKPYLFGIHHCTNPRGWSREERRLFKAIGRRMEDALTSLLMFRTLQESEKGYRKLVTTAPYGIQLTDTEGKIIFSNPAHHKIHGYSDGELIGRYVWELVADEDRRQNARAYYRKIIEAHPEPEVYLSRNKTRDGREIDVQINWDYIHDAKDEIEGIISIISDITHQTRLEEEIRKAQRMESIGTLAGGIAHDFNNILASIIGFTELALDEAPQNTIIEDSLQEVYSAGKRAKELVKQILAFARRSDEKRRPIQVDTIVKEVAKFIRSSIPTTIEIRSAIHCDALIMGNQIQVHQIMMNLCMNAAQAMEDVGGVLSVGLKEVMIDPDAGKRIGLPSGKYIQLSVSDTGPGISPDIINSIFDPYFTTKGTGKGTGMGLAMVHGIVESYGGTVRVDSKMGKGSTFTIYLPVTRKKSVFREYVPEQLPSGTAHILFVDDEPPIAKMGQRILESLGYSVTPCSGSLAALELLRAEPDAFDLVITDMTMPNMTGDKLAIELMKLKPTLPVILCTGYSDKLSGATISETGIKAIAYKPIVKAELASIIRGVLDEAKPKR